MAIEITSVHDRRRLPRPRQAAANLRSALRGAWRGRLRPAPGRVTLLRAFLAALVTLCVSVAAVTGYYYRHYSKLVDERLASGYLTSRAGIYAAPRVLRAGQKLSPAGLGEILRRAGYVEGAASNVWSGRFEVATDGVVIYPRASGSQARASRSVAPDAGSGADAPASTGAVRVLFDGGGRVAGLVGEGGALGAFALEPEPLTNDAAVKTGERAALSYSDLPPVLVRAVLAIEDRRFFEHGGVDPVGVARALFSNAAGEGGQDSKQGGSTITQQLVKNTYLTPERTLRRKFHEAILAGVLERRLSKQDIFALYCNEIYLGQRGSLAVRGVAQAARVYFGKGLKDLTLAEAATIAGMIRSPGRYAPDRHPERARARRSTVLDAMLREGFITDEQARAAAGEEVAVVPAAGADATAPHFVDYVNRLVESRREDDEKAAGGDDLRVHTTIDLELQRVAEGAVSRQLERLGKVFKDGRRPQAALVALDPHTGHVLAMVGGGDYAESQLNRATDARRQPGSVFKPFVYAAAIESGISPLSLSLDAPRDFVYDRRAHYRPANYGHRYAMHDVTLRTGLVRSLNVVTVDAAMRTGLPRVAALAESFGLPKPQAYPSLALGTTEATPLEIASAYTAFADGGGVARPTAVLAAGDASHPAAEQARAALPTQVIKPSTGYMITEMLAAVVKEGTARAARGGVKRTAIAGKTGTTPRDGWFAGYTPNLVCVVWVGFDDGSPLGLTGAESALPAWLEFVRSAVDLRPELGGASFMRPGGLTSVDVDPETGALASPYCPRRESVSLTPALLPQSECIIHREPLGLENPLVAEIVVDAEPETAAAVNDVRLFASSAADIAGHYAALRAEGRAGRPTRVEAGRGRRPVLTNELKVVGSDGSDDWPRYEER